VERYTGSQYDDDLTVGMDDYDDSFQTGDVDLFEFVSDEESPITRLKTIILSIDWEITDDILRQFNMELLDLKDIWANDKIKLVYIQALEKISKYIYKEKANANPNAIKLLLTFYTNLEKIVSNESMPDDEKKALLQADVEKFEKLKKQISRSAVTPEAGETKPQKPFKTAPSFRMGDPLPTEEEHDDPLLNLKAIVFGMDWEITDEDLINLGDEVRHLEKIYVNSKAKLIFLQGIGALGAYINLKRSNAHADAFKLLHSFFLSLENCVRNGLAGEEEKKILLPEVEKFNAFKSAIASTISPEAIAAEGERTEEPEEGYVTAHDEVAPAFADMPEDVHGFQEEEEAASIGGETKQKMEGRIDDFFESETPGQPMAEREPRKNELVEEMESRLDRFFGDELDEQQMTKTNAETALQGVDVETEADDDSEEEALPLLQGELAPALSENIEESSFSEQGVAEEPAPGVLEEEKPSAEDASAIEDVSAALEGVEVETEADDDSGEAPLPLVAGEELAPALFSVEEELEEGEIEAPPSEEETLAGIEDRLDSFFADEPGQPLSPGTEEMGLQAEDADMAEEEEPVLFTEEEPIASLSSDLEEEPAPFEAEAEEDLLLASEEVEKADAGEEEEIPIPEEESILPVEEEAMSADEEEPTLFEAEAEEDMLLAGEEEVVSALEEEPVPLEFDAEETFISKIEEETPAFAEEEEESVLEFEDHLDEIFEAEEPAPALVDEEDIASAFMEEPSEEGIGEVVDTAEFLEEAEEESVSEEPVEEMTFEVEEAEEESFSDELDEEMEFELEEGETFSAVSEEEGPEAELLFEETEEAESSEESEETYTFTGTEGETSSEQAEIQEHEDIIEYIEGVEFDSEEEPEMGYSAAASSEEVVFESIKEEEPAQPEEEMISFSEVEEELDRYLAEQGEEETGEKAEEDYGIERTETFGTGFEEGPVGSEIHMEVFPEPDKFEAMSAVSQMEDLLGKTEIQEEEVVFTAAEDLVETAEGEDPLTPLRNCVVSLGLEINDSILESLVSEINKLHDRWITKPVEKIFLQLLSTVANHIEHYRENASPEAHGLLMSIFNNLELARLSGTDTSEVQEGLLAETSKILLWQQKLLSRNTLEQAEDFNAVFEEAGEDVEVDAITPGSVTDQDGKGTLSQKRKEYLDITSAESEKLSSEALDTHQITQIVRDELETLRKSFREEMGELLRQHLEKNTSQEEE